MSRIPLIQLPAPRAERPNDPLEEKTFKEEVLFNSSFVKMVRDDIKLPDGGLSKRLYLTHGGACAMVALGDDGTILLERQWRHPLKRSFWELPAGKIDPNEEEIACAKRELIEEFKRRNGPNSALSTMRSATAMSTSPSIWPEVSLKLSKSSTKASSWRFTVCRLARLGRWLLTDALRM